MKVPKIVKSFLSKLKFNSAVVAESSPPASSDIAEYCCNAGNKRAPFLGRSSDENCIIGCVM